MDYLCSGNELKKQKQRNLMNSLIRRNKLREIVVFMGTIKKMISIRNYILHRTLYLILRFIYNIYIIFLFLSVRQWYDI